ncbi:Uncharacterised protein [BD1-7 clade bacterium]|uniref:Uncharacterized protein n=1 Tax=BD1-7 clade bacterium TaxID=2029982 RepID=A0A5S9Q8V4_9GAMM|nr:Uncharacterised protein [BD1-7 clade bacterium]
MLVAGSGKQQFCAGRSIVPPGFEPHFLSKLLCKCRAGNNDSVSCCSRHYGALKSNPDGDLACLNR